jgi:hypothetical protein
VLVADAILPWCGTNLKAGLRWCHYQVAAAAVTCLGTSSAGNGIEIQDPLNCMQHAPKFLLWPVSMHP